MPKASLTLANGTVVVIEGTPEEVQELLAFYNPANNTSMPRQAQAATGIQRPPITSEKEHSGAVDLVTIVNQIKSCAESDLIEKNILDKTGQLPRVLLPLYIVSEYMNDAFGLTSGDISKVITQLGTPISLANISKTLAGAASKYVIGDKVRVKGQSVSYKLSRRGIAYFKEIISSHKNSA